MYSPKHVLDNKKKALKNVFLILSINWCAANLKL